MKRLIVPVILSLLAAMLAIVLRSPLAAVEEQITAAKYALCGPQRADTNIVIVYVDSDAMRALGWPLRRNFYALMIKTLTDLQAKAIGIDVLFETPSLEYPEYDQLLRHVTVEARNVVLNCYVESLDADAGAKAGMSREPFRFPHVADVEHHGSDLHTPMPELMDAAAGVGHDNVLEELRVPLFVTLGDETVPAFGVELLRVYAGVDRSGIRYEDGQLSFKKEGKRLRIATEDGTVRLHFPGPLWSFTAYPFLEVLRSYDAVRTGGAPRIPEHTFKNKMVLVGVLSEERTFATPVDPRFPALGVHAVFLDNALRSTFLTLTPEWLVFFLSIIIGAGCASALVLLKSKMRVIVPMTMIAAVPIVSGGVFVARAWILPVVPPLFVGLLATVGAVAYRHRFLAKQLEHVQSEKERIAAALRDREAKVAALERELVSLEARRPADRTEELLEEIRRYKAEIHALSSKRDDLEEAVVVDADTLAGAQEFEGLVYDAGGAMRPVVEFVVKIADSDATVLILGESGTGKEMIARAIHKRSTRRDQPFIAVNCGALSESLLESELFGHEKGAFTGAVQGRQGRFELADGGTIFLDEIGEVSEAFQLKLLRVLQEGEFERVGGTKTLKVNVRVIAATNRDLKELVREKRFREDVYYRLNVLTVEVPPLRSRPEDVPLLIHHFLKKEDGDLSVSRIVLDMLQNYSWRGNVRELESVVKRAVLLAKAEKRKMITMKDLPEEIVRTAKASIALEDQIIQSLRAKRFSRSAISETAEELGGLNRGTVAEYLRGVCLKAFVEHTYDLETTARYIALTQDEVVLERVRKKLSEYLSNIAETVDWTQPWEAVKPNLKPKTKNLPQKYHPFLEQVAEAYFRRVWNLDEEKTGA